MAMDSDNGQTGTAGEHRQSSAGALPTESTTSGSADVLTLNLMRVQKVEVRYLLAECGVRYWEDGEVDGVEDDDGSRIPCRDGDDWKPLIELISGKIVGWPEGVTAKTHYKVCDDGRYRLLDSAMREVCAIDGYVPDIMCPSGGGYGDYVIMEIGPDGKITGWSPDLADFERGPG